MRELHVLLVEDSEDDAMLVLREMKRGGFSPKWERVVDADGLRAALARGGFELVLADYQLPRFSGPAALATLKETGVDVPCIVVSGAIGEEAAVDLMMAGARDFVSKGKLARLVPAIERELAQAEVRRRRAEAERALRASDERFRRVIEMASEGIWVVDAAARTTFVNRRIAELLRRDPAQLVGRPLAELLPEPARSRVVAALERRRLGEAARCELALGGRGGSELSVFVSVAPVFEPGGDYAGSVATFTDVTEHRRLERQLRDAQKHEAVGRLAAGVAHDFSNLVTAVQVGAKLLLDGLAEDPRRVDAADVVEAAERAAGLTRQLLAFSRRQLRQPKVLDLNEVVADAARLLRRQLGEDIVLDATPDPHLPYVRADVGQLHQIVTNLGVNARDAMPSGGRLSLVLRSVVLDGRTPFGDGMPPAGRYAALAVTDNGTGIPGDVLPHVFEPYFTTKGAGRGTGLGLPTVHGLVKQSEGYLRVATRPGEGTTFEIILPEAKEPRVPAAVKAGGRDARAEATILLVDDEALVRRPAARALARCGYSVIEAEGGAHALAIARTEDRRIDLLLTDVVMPWMSGTYLAQALAAERPDMRVLFMSGQAEDDVVERNETGAPLLLKPFTPEALVARVRDALEGPAGSRSVPGAGGPA